MPLTTLVALAVPVTAFVAFTVVLGGTHIWLALADRAEARTRQPVQRRWPARIGAAKAA